MSTIDLSKPTFKSDLYGTCEHRQLSRNGNIAWCGDCGSTFGGSNVTVVRHRLADTYRCEHANCSVSHVAKSLPEGWLQYGESRHPDARSGIASWCPKHKRAEFPTRQDSGTVTSGVNQSTGDVNV